MSAPKITVLVDVDRGATSVAHLIRSAQNPTGNVIRVRAQGYVPVLETVDALRRKRLVAYTVPGEKDPVLLGEDEYDNIGAVVCDTASRLADITRRALVNSEIGGSALWAQREKLFPAQRDWGNMSDMLARVFEQYVSWCDDHDATFIMVCHEKKVTDEATGSLKGGPDANPKLLSEIIEISDYVWRVWREEAAVKLKHQGRDVSFPKNTHFVRMTTSEFKVTKMRLPPEYSEKLEDNLPNANLQEAFGLLGPFVPKVLTLFGPPGGGKTTLACSLSDPKYYKET